eukprot:560357-Prorocentrum_minimum.AAC.3
MLSLLGAWQSHAFTTSLQVSDMSFRLTVCIATRTKTDSQQRRLVEHDRPLLTDAHRAFVMLMCVNQISVGSKIVSSITTMFSLCTHSRSLGRLRLRQKVPIHFWFARLPKTDHLRARERPSDGMNGRPMESEPSVPALAVYPSVVRFSSTAALLMATYIARAA